MMVNDRCTNCGGGHICQQRQSESLTPHAIFSHIMRRDEEMVKEHVKEILREMICEIVEHVPVRIDDRVEEIVNSCRGLRVL